MKNTNFRKLKKYIKYIITFFIIDIIGFIYILLGIKLNNELIILYNYKAEKNSDYEVILKENDFYDSRILPSEKYYASQSIDDILINFRYDFKASRNVNIRYNYNIVAELIGTSNQSNDEGKQVWNRKFIIQNMKFDNILDNDKFSITEENIDIDYEYYNSLVQSYEKEFKISINAILKVRLNIYYNIRYNSINMEENKIEDFIELDIPINNTVTEVTREYEDSKEDNIFSQENNINFYKSICFIIVILILFENIILIKLFIKRKVVTSEDLYRKNINQILKYYKELIITVENEPDLKNLKFMYIRNIDDLIDVAEQNSTNIIHYEKIKDKESILYVIVHKYVYIYEVTDKKN